MKFILKIMREEKHLFVWTGIAFLLIFIRILWIMKSGSSSPSRQVDLLFVFLIWNLFLAWIPLLISRNLLASKKPKQLQYFMLALWLLFFPNAPYLLTDLIHLRARPPIPIWYDSLILFTFAGLGLWLAIRSLVLVRAFIFKQKGKRWAEIWAHGSLLLSGFGVYLGRVLRWNSWDIFSNPIGPINDIFILICNPIQHKSAWLMIFLFSGLMSFLYWTVKSQFAKKSQI